MRPVLQIKFLFLILTMANGQNKIHKSSLKPIEYSVTTEINYAGNMNMAQTLDVYIPKNRKYNRLPVIVNIHGESILWGNGDKMWGGDTPFLSYLQSGSFACIKINYRLSSESKWPAQLYDCKAAIRWIKGNAERFGFDKNKIAVQGVLAGGHLALMLGLTRNENKFEGDVGNYLSEDSKISCVVSGFSPSNLEELGGEEVESLLGGETDSFTKKANEASPINWISKENDIPIYLYQGNAEKKVPMSQTDLFYNLTKKTKFKNVYYQKIINGSKRNLQRDSKINKLINSRIEDFYKKHLLKKDLDLEVSDLSLKSALIRGERR